MSKHTPGPWRVEAYGVIVGPSNGFSPFGGCGCCDSPWMNGHDGEACQADARLIAAAPELLEALKECLPYVSQTLANTGSMDAYYTEAKACAAIAKAEGEKA